MFRKNQLHLAIVLASSAVIIPAQAQIEEILVTSTKREESMQDVPVAVSALTEESLDQLGVSNFEDYLLQLPNVPRAVAAPVKIQSISAVWHLPPRDSPLLELPG
jgi:iron complex outermembrane receptor protein